MFYKTPRHIKIPARGFLCAWACVMYYGGMRRSTGFEGKPVATEVLEKDAVLVETIEAVLSERLPAIEEKLVSSGVMRTERNETLGREVCIIDLQRLAERDVGKDVLRQQITVGGKRISVGKREVLIQLLKGRVGLTADQVKKGESVEKPFLYIPETIDTASSLVDIKNVAFHAGIWELSQSTDFLQSHPTQEVADKGYISELEVRVAAMIFHPSYGDGFRDENGTLVIRDASTRKYVPFSWAVFTGYGISDNALLSSTSDDDRPLSLQEGMVQKLPHLIQKGLLIPERDVRAMSLRDGEKRDVVRRRINTSGYIMINGVNHFFLTMLFHTTNHKQDYCTGDNSEAPDSYYKKR